MQSFCFPLLMQFSQTSRVPVAEGKTWHYERGAIHWHVFESVEHPLRTLIFRCLQGLQATSARLRVGDAMTGTEVEAVETVLGDIANIQQKWVE